MAAFVHGSQVPDVERRSVIAGERAIDNPEGPHKDRSGTTFGRRPVSGITVGVEPAMMFEMGPSKNLLETEGEQKTVGDGQNP